MSKINSLQAAALNGTTTASSPATTDKPAVEKKKASVKAVKPAISKPVAAKPAEKAPAKAAAKSAAKVETAPKAKPVAKATDKITAKPVVKKVIKPAEAKQAKTPKLKMERDSFTMPKTEYAQLYVLKERLIKLGQASKKSELLRAGIMQLTAMTDAALKAAMAKVPAIKTGRPKKK